MEELKTSINVILNSYRTVMSNKHLRFMNLVRKPVTVNGFLKKNIKIAVSANVFK